MQAEISRNVHVHLQLICFPQKRTQKATDRILFHNNGGKKANMVILQRRQQNQRRQAEKQTKTIELTQGMEKLIKSKVTHTKTHQGNSKNTKTQRNTKLWTETNGKAKKTTPKMKVN
jgi:hypothetical protein